MSTRPETAYERGVRRAREQFDASIAEHRMTVLLDTLDDGTPYRHVRFAKPGTSIWSFNLVTWPGHLSISGDLQSFTFRRLHDMFDFFGGPGSVNPSYWGEKLVAESRGTQYGDARFSEDHFMESLASEADIRCEDLTEDDARRFRAAVKEEILEYGPPQHLETAMEALNAFRWEPEDSDSYPQPIRFDDAHEWDMGGYDHHFLLCCHAIQWGVRTYLEANPGRVIPEGCAA